MLLCGFATVLFAGDKAGFRPQIPRIWVEAELEEMDVPVSQPAYSQKAVAPEYYYQIPVAPIYKSYPVYAPGRAPAGYMEKLKRLPPELAFDAARLKTKDDWIRAGEIVFDAPTATTRKSTRTSWQTPLGIRPRVSRSRRTAPCPGCVT